MATKETKKEVIQIKPLKMQYLTCKIIGTSPLVINAFSQKARDKIRDEMAKGPSAKTTKKARTPRDFNEDYQGHRHLSPEGWDGIPATAIKNAMVSACRTVGYVMTRSKIGFFIVADSFDKSDMTPLIKITKGEPSPVMHWVSINNGQSMDLANRPVWGPGWEAMVTIKYDEDMLSKEDVMNLLHRAGQQVGICAGRPSSKKSVGMDWGMFKIEGYEED